MTDAGGIEDGPRIVRVRHELRRRALNVLRVERLAPKMVRIVLGGSELGGFTSLGFDDHIKLFFPAASSDAPAPSTGAPGGAVMRDFTPRRYDPVAGELWIDFFLHEAGPAAAWAAQACAGQQLLVGGPRGSAVIETGAIGLHVLIGDETALPAIHRRLEELPAGAQAWVLVETEPGAPWHAARSDADLEVTWVARDGKGGGPGHELVAALRQRPLPPERCFCWVAGESQSARALRRYLVEERGISKRWIKAAGYWQRGAAGSHELIEEG